LAIVSPPPRVNSPEYSSVIPTCSIVPSCFVAPSCCILCFVYFLGSKFRKNSGQNSGSGPFSGIFGSGVAGIIFLDFAFFRTFLIKETEMRHRCDSRIINYLTLMTLKPPEMTGTKSKFRSKFRFRLDSMPATGRNFAGILNLVTTLIRLLRTAHQKVSRLHDYK
jgi:hypothetical protein